MPLILFLELNHNEPRYKTLIRDTPALKEFIAANSKQQKILDRIADLKNFSSRKFLERKNNLGVRGLLRPQLKQIVSNPHIFSKGVPDFASYVIKENLMTVIN